MARLLVIGGCGSVGSMVLPWLAERHEIRVLDVRDPVDPVDGVEYRRGDARDGALVAGLVTGVDSLVFMAMGPLSEWETAECAVKHLDVAVPTLHHVLARAHEAGVTNAVYTSSMSAYRYLRPDGTRADYDEPGCWPDERTTPDETRFYGLAKRLAEQVCTAASVEWGMDVVALRLCFPATDAEWPRHRRFLERAVSTSARDVAAAIDAALARHGHGFEAFNVSGDAAGRVMSIAKARDVLGWEPRDRC